MVFVYWEIKKGSAEATSFLVDGVLKDKTCQHKAEDGCDMSQGAVDLRFRRAPFMVQEIWIAGTVLGFGTHALLCATGGIVPHVF